MQIMFHLEEYPNGKTETPTNFRIAEAIVNLSKDDDRIDAATVAKMILLQVDAMKGGEER